MYNHKIVITIASKKPEEMERMHEELEAWASQQLLLDIEGNLITTATKE